MGRHRSDWEQARRTLYFIQRAMGDMSAANRGTLGKRLVRRQLTRTTWGPLINRLFR